MSEEKLNLIIDYFGEDNQERKAIEKLVELTELLIKDVNKNELNIEDLYSEIADVYIMLAQIKIIFELDDECLQAEINRKIDRTLMSIGDRQQKCGGRQWLDNTKYDAPCGQCVNDEPPQIFDKYGGMALDKAADRLAEATRTMLQVQEL